MLEIIRKFIFNYVLLSGGLERAFINIQFLKYDKYPAYTSCSTIHMPFGSDYCASKSSVAISCVSFDSKLNLSIEYLNTHLISDFFALTNGLSNKL